MATRALIMLATGGGGIMYITVIKPEAHVYMSSVAQLRSI